MSELKQKVHADMIQAMKSKDTLKVSVLRMVKAAILKQEVSGQRSEVKDDDVIQILKKEIKQRKDAAEQFSSGGRQDLAEKEEKESLILSEYLPKQMDEKQLEKVVREVIEDLKVSSKQEFGKVMGAVMSRVKGSADGNLVKAVVEKVLEKI